MTRHRILSKPELILQVGHSNEIYALAFAPDGGTLAAAGSERTVRLWDAISGELRALLPQGQTCRALAFSPDGAVLACAGDGEVVLWDPHTTKRKATLSGQCGAINALAFSPEGKLLACASEGHWFGHEVMWVKGGEVQLWDVAAARRKRAIGKSRTEKTALAWSADGKLLAVAGSDHAVRLWDLAAGQPQRSVLRHKEVRALAFAPDGQSLASGGEDGAKLWDLRTMKVRQALRGDEVTSVAFSPAGDKLAAGSRSSVLLYDAGSGKREAVLEKNASDSGVSNVAFSPDGNTLARGSNAFLRPGNIKMWDVASKKLKRLIAGNETSEVSAVVFSPDGHSLYSAGGVFEQAGDVTRWDAETGAMKQVLVQQKDDISSLTLSPDGGLLLAPVGAKLLSWDPRTGKSKSPLPVSGNETYALSPDGTRIAVVDEDAGVRLLDAQTKKVQRTIRRQPGVLAFSPDGLSLAMGSERGLSLWDIGTGTLKWEAEKPRLDVNQIVYSADGRFIAVHTIHWKGTKGKDEVRVREAASGDLVQVIGLDDMPSSVLFSPDNTTLAVAAAFAPERDDVPPRAVIQFWDTQRWRLRRRLLYQAEEVKNLTFSADSKFLAATHGDRTATLWDPRRGTRLQVLEDSSGEVTCVAFSPDGKKLATGNHDGWVRLWEAKTARSLVTLRVLPGGKPQGAKEWIAFTPEGYYNASSGATRFIRWREGNRLLGAKALAGKFRRPDLVARELRAR